MINPMDLTGKHIVVTGASSGVGQQTAVTLSQLGAKVSILARNEANLQKTLDLMEGEGHKAYPFDVRNIDDIEGLVKTIVADGGKIDGFVHVAGIGTSKPIGMTRYDFILDMMNIHLFSFVEFARVIGKKKFSNDWCSYVGISSSATFMPGGAKVAYTTTKGALDASVRALSVDLGISRKQRFNTINPAWIHTQLFDQTVANLGQEQMDEMAEKQFLGVMEPENVAMCIAFLVSDASRMITGRNILMDGGYTLH